MIECVIFTNDQHAESLIEVLQLLGAHACTLNDAADQPIYEPELDALVLWKDIVLTAYFSDEEENQIQEFLSNNPLEKGIVRSMVRPVPEKDWVRMSLDQFKPQVYGNRLAIYPSWCERPDVYVAIQLDPGLAFGTGSHPTTRLCLEYLSEHMTAEEMVIDYGCGSGILALAAKKLGAKKVIAIDHDEQALIACRQNAIANQIQISSDAFLVGFTDVIFPEKADLLMANILAQPLVDLAPRLTELIKINGKIILSGILKEQVELVLAAYKNNFDFARPIILDGWCLLQGRKKI